MIGRKTTFEQCGRISTHSFIGYKSGTVISATALIVIQTNEKLIKIV